MDKRRLALLGQRLLEMRQIAAARLADMEAGVMDESLKESTKELSSYDNHPADLATETFHRELAVGLIDLQHQMVASIDRVLAKMVDGTYGICEHCGREIAIDRLEVIPFTVLCKDCQETEERLPVRNPRPIEEETIRQLFDKLFGDGKDSVGVDGEDTWQDVAQYGTSNTFQDIGMSADRLDASYVDSDETVGGTEEVDFVIDDEPHGLEDSERDRQTTSPDR